MMPATSENEKVRFHTLNRETQNRVVSHYVDSVTGKEVREEDEVKGYQRGEDDYVMLEDEELENVALDSTKTIDISTFTPVAAMTGHTVFPTSRRRPRTSVLEQRSSTGRLSSSTLRAGPTLERCSARLVDVAARKHRRSPSCLPSTSCISMGTI